MDVSISKTKEAIRKMPDDASVDYVVVEDVAFVTDLCSADDLKALAESHTRLLEAAKLLFSEELQSMAHTQTQAVLFAAIAEAEK
jgi:hypothetical protein